MASNISFSNPNKTASAVAVGDGFPIGDTNVGDIGVGSGWGIGDVVGGGVIRGDSKKEVGCGKGSKSTMGVGNTGEIVGNGVGIWVDVGPVKLIVSDIVTVDVITVD